MIYADMPSEERAHTSVLIAIGMTLAEMDFTAFESRTADGFLQRVHENLQSFCETALMTQTDETTAQDILDTLVRQVAHARQTIRDDPT